MLHQQCSNVSQLILGVADYIGEPNTTHVRCPCEFISTCLHGLKHHDVMSIKPLISALFHQLDNEIRIVAQPCQSAPTNIAGQVRHRRTIATFLEHSALQSKEQRSAFAGPLALMLQG
jgi:hypothetical protein